MSVPLFHMIAGAPEPVAPFSHAVEQDGWVFVTGQLPFTGLANDSPYPEGIEAQTRQVLANLQPVLAGCGLGLAHVLGDRLRQPIDPPVSRFGLGREHQSHLT